MKDRSRVDAIGCPSDCLTIEIKGVDLSYFAIVERLRTINGVLPGVFFDIFFRYHASSLEFRHLSQWLPFDAIVPQEFLQVGHLIVLFER